MSPLPEIPLDEIASADRVLLHGRKSSAQANVYRLNWRGRPAALKDFSANSWPARMLWARPLLRREARALALLADSGGSPKPLGWAGPDALLMEFIEGLPVSKLAAPPAPEFFDAAEVLLRRSHTLGVVHGDIRRFNILADADGRPWLIDFASAQFSSPGALAAPARFIWRRVAAADLFHIVKIKASYHPHALTEAQRRTLETPPLTLRIGRFLRKKIYRFKKPRHRAKLWRRFRRWLKGRGRGG